MSVAPSACLVYTWGMMKKYAVEGLTGYPNELAQMLDEANEQNAELVAALKATQLLLDDIYAEDSIISSSDLGTVYEGNKQALAKAGKD